MNLRQEIVKAVAESLDDYMRPPHPEASHRRAIVAVDAFVDALDDEQMEIRSQLFLDYGSLERLIAALRGPA